MHQYTHLVVSDTNHIIDYLFASSKYKIIRSASFFLDELNTQNTMELIQRFQGVTLSLGGGETRVLFTNDKAAKQYAAALQALYLNETKAVTVTVAVVPAKDGESIAQWITRADRCLRYEEMTQGKKLPTYMELPPIIKRCESCLKRAANHLKDEVYYCESCMINLQQSRSLSENILQKRVARIAERTSAQLNTQSNSEQVNTTNPTIEDLTDHNTIGFIYVDGKNIGKKFKAIADSQLSAEAFITQYQNLSIGIQEALIMAAHRTELKLKEICQNRLVKVDYALIGGDDLVAITSGKNAPLYAYYLLNFFEEETEKHAFIGTKECLAAGVIIANKKYPIYQLYNLSYELMDRTKRQNDGSSLDFQVMTDATIQSVALKRSEHTHTEKRSYYGEGYSLQKNVPNSFSALYETGRTLKEKSFPNTKIKGIFHITVEPNEEMLKFTWREWLSRIKTEHSIIFERWHKELKTTPFVHTKQDKSYTYIRDLFDLYDLIDREVSIHD